MMTPPRYRQRNSENRKVYLNLEVTDDSAIAQGNNHCYEHEHESTGRNPTDSHMGYEQEERYEDLRERNQAPDMYGSRRNYATTHNPRRNESEFIHRERTPEPRCRQEQRTAGSSDPLIVLVQGLLDRLDHRTGESSERRPSSPPDYLKMVTLMKKCGTVIYPRGTDPFEASTWLRNLEKNFRAIHCPDNFKKDVAIYYLTKDASDWWDNVEEYYIGRDLDWEDFKTEFERKYFPPEAKDRLEIQFLELTQGNRKVREYEAEFTKLRKYSPYGARNEGALIRRFIRGLRADLASRLQVVKFHSLYELAEIAVNVQEGMEKEQAMMKHSEPSRRTEGLGIRRMNNKGQFNRGRSRGRRNDRRFGNGPNVCYTCGGTGHFSSSCPYSQGRKASDYITCFSCGEKGHYANSCPHKRQVTLPAPPTRLAIEPAPNRQAVGKRVNALELGKPEPQQPHQGPITGN